MCAHSRGECRERGSSGCLLPYAAGTQPCPQTQSALSRWKAQVGKIIVHYVILLSGQLVFSMVLCFKLSFWREFVWAGFVLGGPTKCTFHYLISRLSFLFPFQPFFFYFLLSCLWCLMLTRISSSCYIFNFRTLCKFDAEKSSAQIEAMYLSWWVWPTNQAC